MSRGEKTKPTTGFVSAINYICTLIFLFFLFNYIYVNKYFSYGTNS